MDTLAIIHVILSSLLGVYVLLFIFRIVLTWYPRAELNKLPFAIAVMPTEFLLAPTRRLIPPLGGVDITPIIWVGIVSFIREISLGQQGLLTLIQIRASHGL
ncbi:MAG: YggT family protein [Cyanobacteria bacterium P01_F01_bin.42]